MYKINEETGDIICPDGYVISIPYEDKRYQDYAKWVGKGNKPEVVNVQE